MKIKCFETFEYELELSDEVNDTQINESIWTIENTLDCVSSMTTPFWDGYPEPELIERTFRYEKVEE